MTGRAATTERRALGSLAVVAGLTIAWLAWPFAVSVLLGALMGFVLEPVHLRVSRRTGRPLLSAAITVAASGVAVVMIGAGFITLFVMRMVGFATSLREALKPAGPLAASADSATRWLAGYGLTATSLTDRLEAGAGEIASHSAAIAGTVAAGTFSAVLGLFFALLTMYAVLRHWPRMISAVVVVSPLNPEHTRAVLTEFRRAGRATLAGTVVTGLAQGTLAGLGYWMSGVPEPGFFGAATAVASLLPGVGTLLIWVPAGIYLFATGHTSRAIVELVWCSLMVVGFSDYVIRPTLVGDEGMPAVLVFVALFGGVEMMGLAGLIVGPILMAIALATLRLYGRELRSANPRLHSPRDVR